MKRYKALLESVIDIENLPKETILDIAYALNWYNNSLHNSGLFNTTESIADFILDTPHLTVDIKKENPNKYYNKDKFTHSISRKAVNKYKKMIEQGVEFHPILVSKGKFIDGGHRLVAYYELKKHIPTVDITSILEHDWNKEIQGML